MLLASDMASYYCKGSSLMPGHSYLGANEWLFARFARLIGLPVRNTEVIEWKGDLFVGGQILSDDRRITGGLTPATWDRLGNRAAVVYPLIALDAWTINQDRHAGNWLGSVISSSGGWFLANDHDMALLPPGRTPNDLAVLFRMPVERCVLIDVIRNEVTDEALLQDSVRSIERLNDDTITYQVSQVPMRWLTAEQKGPCG